MAPDVIDAITGGSDDAGGLDRNGAGSSRSSIPSSDPPAMRLSLFRFGAEKMERMAEAGG